MKTIWCGGGVVQLVTYAIGHTTSSDQLIGEIRMECVRGGD